MLRSQTPRAVAERLRRIASAIVAESLKAETETIRELAKRAVKITSGPLSTAELRKRDHPYARRHGRITRASPWLINRQSGALVADWTTGLPVLQGGRIHSYVMNNNEVIGYLTDGTSKMLPRHIDDRLLGQIQSFRYRRHELALARALNTR